MAEPPSTAMVVQPVGLKGPSTVSDAALMARCKSEHQCSVTRAISRELIANNNTWSIERRDQLMAGGKAPPQNWYATQLFEFFESGENKLFQPTLKISSNSYMGEAAAAELFNVDTSSVKDSTFGQGAKLAMLTLSADVQAEIYAYDSRTSCGTVTMYLVEEGMVDHSHLTISFYVIMVSGKPEIYWLTKDGELSAIPEKQADYLTFRKYTLMKQVKDNVVMPIKNTDKRIREIVHELVKEAKGNYNESCVVQYISGTSWVDDPPIKKVPVNEGGDKYYDLVCRVPDTSTNSQWKSLAEIIKHEWRSFAMTTTALPNHETAPAGVTVCYKRKIKVGNVSVAAVSPSENMTHADWVVHHVEAGLKLRADDPGYTATYMIKLNEQEKKNADGETLYNYATVRACVHPDARGAVVVDGDGKQKGTSAGQYNARGYCTGGAAFYHGRYHGTGDQLLKGEMSTTSDTSSAIFGIPPPNDLQAGLGGGGPVVQGRKRIVEYATLMGCTPDPAGNIKKSDDLKTLDKAVAGGRDNAGLNTVFALTQPASKAQAGRGNGLKPDGRTDFMPKLIGYDVVYTIEHTAGMKPDKVHIADAAEARTMIIGVRTALAQHALAYDPAFASVRAQLESETYNPIQYDNSKKGGDKDPVPSQAIGAPTGGRTTEDYTKRNEASKAYRDARLAGFVGEVLSHTKKYVETYLGMSQEMLKKGPQDVGDSGNMPDEWPEESAEFQLLELLSTSDMGGIEVNSNQGSSLCRRPAYAMKLFQERVSKCTAFVDEPVRSERKDRMIGLYEGVINGLTDNKPSSGTKRTRSDAATPAGDALEASGGGEEQEQGEGAATATAGGTATATATGAVDEMDDDDDDDDDDTANTDAIQLGNQPVLAAAPLVAQGIPVRAMVADQARRAALVAMAAATFSKRARTIATYSDNAIEEQYAAAAGDTPGDLYIGGDKSMTGTDRH